MHEVKILKFNKKNFNLYGHLVEIPAPGQPTIETNVVKFWKQQAIFAMGEKIEVGVLTLKKQEMVFNELENHFKTPTLLLCLDGDFILPVAPPSDNIPSASEVVAFQVPKNQTVVLAEKCWHGVTYPIDKDTITLLVFFKEDSLDEDTVYKSLDKKCTIVLD